jgi:aspartyl-tRNA(Asn)/glutamyl-tRNA(Gln) amidotransferase subunit A
MFPHRSREPGVEPAGSTGARLATYAARARRLDPVLHAFVQFRDPEIPAQGALSGLPYAAKDIFAAPDRAPHGGLAQPLPPTDCHTADALRLMDEAGAVRLGYTALTEIAYEPSGANLVRNPWNPDFIPGGSSSGSAAAVASGSVVLALGSDTAGSLRIPAQGCGVTAWKPTHVSTRGAMPLAPSLDTIGLLARGAAEIVPAARVLADLDETPVRSGLVIGDALAAAHPSVARACQDGIDLIASGVALGRRDGLALIESADAPLFTILQGEAARCHRGLLDSAAIGPVLRRRLAKGLDIDDAALAAALAQREPLAAAFLAWLRQSDVAILPVMTIRTPPAAECDPERAEFRPRTLYELSRLTRFVNMIGFPAVALPVGFDDRGLPVALQIVGRPGADLALLALAAAVQQRSDWHGRVPAAIASLVAQEGGIE